MKSETKANLAFLIVFLLLTIPGAVILFRKKLDPNAPKMFLPDAVKTRVAYMVPWDGTAKRVAPSITWNWVNQLCQDRAGVDALTRMEDGQAAPVMSSDHVIQLVARKKVGEQEEVFLLIWNDFQVAPSDLKISASDDRGIVAGSLVLEQITQVPKEVQKELASFDYTKPPRQVIWLRIRLPRQLSPPGTLKVERKTDDQKIAISVINFT